MQESALQAEVKEATWGWWLVGLLLSIPSRQSPNMTHSAS